MASQIGEVEYTYLRREENQFADALARLASMVRIPNDLTHMPLVIERRQEPAHEEEIEVHNLTQDEPVHRHQKLLGEPGISSELI